MVYAVANSSNYAQDDNFHDAIHFYNYLDNSYVLSFINHKRSNNAEQNNVYDIVNSYNYTETAKKKKKIIIFFYFFYFFFFFFFGGGVLNLVIVHCRTMFMM